MAAETLRILEHRPMGRDAFLLRLHRPSWSWKPGQLVGLCGEDPHDHRDYSIASAPQDETLDILYRLIPHGKVTPFLARKRPGDFLPVEGPYGRFTLCDPTRPLLFCATGTGVAPFRSFLRAYPDLRKLLLHGVRYSEDLYFAEEFRAMPGYRAFCSRGSAPGAEAGRLTAALHELDLAPDTHVYLCGANEMIYEAEEILLARGIPKSGIFQEPYYYRAYDD